MKVKYQFFIINFDNQFCEVPIEEGFTLQTKRQGEPATLKCTTLNKGYVGYAHGSPCKLVVNGKVMFFGFLFKKERNKWINKIDLTFYDQMIYLKKNKDTYQYKNLTANQVIQMIANDFQLNCGTLENTGYVIPKKIEDNKTLIDIIQNALDDTLTNTNKLYCLYDSGGKLMLQNVENMKTDYFLDADSGADFNYESSIDNETYNKIKLVYNNQDTGKREVYIAQDSATMNTWGVLQYYESISSPKNAVDKCNSLLAYHDRVERRIKVSNAIGRADIRAGKTILVNLKLRDVEIKNYMMIEECKHTFKNNLHLMDLTLRGGIFIS